MEFKCSASTSAQCSALHIHHGREEHEQESLACTLNQNSKVHSYHQFISPSTKRKKRSMREVNTTFKFIVIINPIVHAK